MDAIGEYLRFLQEGKRDRLAKKIQGEMNVLKSYEEKLRNKMGYDCSKAGVRQARGDYASASWTVQKCKQERNKQISDLRMQIKRTRERIAALKSKMQSVR